MMSLSVVIAIAQEILNLTMAGNTYKLCKEP